MVWAASPMRNARPSRHARGPGGEDVDDLAEDAHVVGTEAVTLAEPPPRVLLRRRLLQALTWEDGDLEAVATSPDGHEHVRPDWVAELGAHGEALGARAAFSVSRLSHTSFDSRSSRSMPRLVRTKLLAPSAPTMYLAVTVRSSGCVPSDPSPG